MTEDRIASGCLPDSSLRGVDFRGARSRVDPDGSISTSFSSGRNLEVRAEARAVLLLWIVEIFSGR